MGVKEVIAKAVNELHAKLLQKLGISRVVHPERDMAIRLATSLLVGGFMEEINLAPGYSIYEVKAPISMVGKSLKELDIRRRYDLTVLVIKRGDKILVNPSGDEIIRDGDILLVLGKYEKLIKLG